jgi:hypothetical protein
MVTRLDECKHEDTITLTKEYRWCPTCGSISGPLTDEAWRTIREVYERNADLFGPKQEAVEALLEIEWITDGSSPAVMCPACLTDGGDGDVLVHRERCATDAALKANGFPDQASRNKERADIHARRLKAMAESGEYLTGVSDKK